MTEKQLVCEIHQVIPVQHEHFVKLFQHSERQVLQKVGTKATGPSNALATIHVPVKTAAEEGVARVSCMTSNEQVELQVCPSYVETDATGCCIPDMKHVVNQLESEV